LEALFSAANLLALTGWAALLASPLMPRIAPWAGGVVVPLVLASGYTALVLGFWSRASGGFSSLADVATLFETQQLLLAGWIHYLAFDLFVGTWITVTARRDGIPHWMTVPVLALTFLFGPAGFLAFQALRLARGRFDSAF
jgi:hypothetical protein